MLSLEAELGDLSIDLPSFKPINIVLEQKRGSPNEIGHSRDGARTKIHAVMDSYVYPIYLMLSEGQRNDCNFPIPVLKRVYLEGCNVLADRGYNSDELIDYIYTHGAVV